MSAESSGNLSASASGFVRKRKEQELLKINMGKNFSKIADVSNIRNQGTGLKLKGSSTRVR
jgi:hypothetical protein